jgi:hypothetical protein
MKYIITINESSFLRNKAIQIILLFPISFYTHPLLFCLQYKHRPTSQDSISFNCKNVYPKYNSKVLYSFQNTASYRLSRLSDKFYVICANKLTGHNDLNNTEFLREQILSRKPSHSNWGRSGFESSKARTYYFSSVNSKNL